MKKLFISLWLLIGGLAIFVLGTPYHSVYQTNGSINYNLMLTAIFFILALIIKKINGMERYAPALYALFVASAAQSLLNTGILNLRNVTTPLLKNLAIDKFSQFLHIVPICIVLVLLSGNTLNSIFIQVGKLKSSLRFGFISFGVFGLLFIFIGISTDALNFISWKTFSWLLLFIFTNAIMEELWFRGIFLKSYEPLIGRTLAILITALVFGISHVFATYEFPGGRLIFGSIVFTLGAVGASAMFKDDSIIGPILLHAGYDLLVIVPVLNSM